MYSRGLILIIVFQKTCSSLFGFVRAMSRVVAINKTTLYVYSCQVLPYLNNHIVVYIFECCMQTFFGDTVFGKENPHSGFYKQQLGAGSRSALSPPEVAGQSPDGG